MSHRTARALMKLDRLHRRWDRLAADQKDDRHNDEGDDDEQGSGEGGVSKHGH